jgi:hypothetical protein
MPCKLISCEKYLVRADKCGYISRFTLQGNFCLKLSHVNRLQFELYCVNQAHSSLTLSQASYWLDIHSTTQVVSRLHATVLDKSCVAIICLNYQLYGFCQSLV